jgi:hypothetical protein
METKLRYKFSVDESGADIDSGHYQRYTVDKGVNASRTVQFMVEGHDDAFIDLSKCYVKTVFRVVNENGTELEPDADVWPTENYANNLWSQCNVSLNNTPLPPGNDYPYTSLLIDLLGASPEARRDTLGPLAGVSGAHFGGSDMALTRSNTYTLNKALVAKSARVTVYDRIHHDFMMSCSQLLPNRMQISITLTRTKDSFVLCKGIDESRTFKIDIVSSSLFVKRIHLNPAGRSLIESSLSSGGKLLFQRLHTIAFPCSAPSHTFSWHDTFGHIVPRKAFCCLVKQSSFFGSWEKASHYLESSNISVVSFRLGGREIMAEPYRTEWRYEETGRVSQTLSDAKSAFAGLCRVIGTFSSPRTHLGITYANFLDSCTIFAVDLDHADGIGPVHGSFDIHIEFLTPLEEPMMVIVMGEYPKTITFDASRQITEV